MMTKDLGRVVITASTLEEFVEQSILVANKRGLATPSVIVKNKGGSATMVTFNREHASLRDLLCFAADAAHADYGEYVGRVILGDHRHPLLTSFEAELPHPVKSTDPFMPPK